MDFTSIISAIPSGGIVAALTALAALKILPPVAKWGYNHVITWFGFEDAEQKFQREVYEGYGKHVATFGKDNVSSYEEYLEYRRSTR